MDAPTLPLNPIAAGAALPPRAALLPPLPRAGGSGDGLTPAQRRMMIAAIVAAHAAGVWGLLQIGAVREAVLEAAPMFVDLIAPPTPPTLPPQPPQPPLPKPQPIVKEAPPRVPVIAAAPSPAPSSFVVPAPPPEPVVIAAPAAPPAVAAPAPPAAPPAPRNLPASAVQYASTVEPEYPRVSRRNGESGRVMVRVFIDEAGAPRQVQLNRSSGFERLDASALAAVLKFRFRPPTEDGQPVSGWANVPIDFGLEK